MNRIFYDHLIQSEEIVAELDGDELEIEEKQELLAIMDETFHQEILKLILDHLPVEQHETFLTRFYQEPYSEKLLDFLKGFASDIEEKIQQQAQEIKKELLAEIRRSRKAK